MHHRLVLSRIAISLGLLGPAVAHEGGHHVAELGGTPTPRSIRVTVNAEGRVNPWNHLDFRNDPNAFQFAIVSDRTGGARPGVFEDAVRKLNLLQPEFVMSVGDLIEGYSQDPAEVNTQWDEFQSFIRNLQMPFFYVAGNHDHSNPVMAGIWRKRFGRPYYSFVYRDVLFLCLNSQEPAMHHLSATQAQWVRETLAAHPEVRWTLAFLHTPLWEYPAERGWPEIEAALQGRPHTVFAGHYHSYLKSERQDARYYILATTGGGSALRGPAYGEFDQVAWVTMTADGPIVANLMLDGIRADDIRTTESKPVFDALIARGFTTDVIWLVDGRPAKHSVELESANPTAVPVDISFHLSTSPNLTAKLGQGFATTADGRSIFTLQPRSSRALTLDLAGDFPTHEHQAQIAAQLRWEARLQPDGSPPLRLDESLIIPVVPRLILPVLPGPVRMDGEDTDWSKAHLYSVMDNLWLRSPSEGWTGPDDCSFRLGVTRDETNLYLLVAVKDDRVISIAGVPPWKQDGIEVRVDFRAPAVQRAAQVKEDGLLFIGSSPAAGTGLDPEYIYNPASLPAGTVVCNRLTDDGYVFEASIPLQALATLYGEEWKEDGFRLNVAVNDRDGEGQAQLWWQPDWRTRDNIPASGTFFLR
jgi:hypothetical protein